MKAGLVGYAQTGKTTLFNALTGLGAQTGGGRTAATNLGVLKVPDVRIDKLSAMYKPKKTIYAEVSLVDVPGPRTKGSGLESGVIQALREADALVVVVRGFEQGEKAEPVKELLDFDAELMLNDQIVIERRLERTAKEKGHDREKAALEKCLAALNDGKALRLAGLTPEDEREVVSYAFLSLRPMLAVLNVAEADATRGVPEALVAAAKEKHIEVISVCGSIEAEISSLPAAEQADFLSSMGIAEPASARLIRSAYHLLDYISFFTVGEDEVRAWNVHRGDKAPRAAGRVHSDIERGFIRAEVMKHTDLLELGSEARMKEAGKLRVEGKEYVVIDGDILHFRFNV
jgi:hypothetical protein